MKTRQFDDAMVDALHAEGIQGVSSDVDGVIARIVNDVTRLKLVFRVFPQPDALVLEALASTGPLSWDALVKRIYGPDAVQDYCLANEDFKEPFSGEIGTAHQAVRDVLRRASAWSLAQDFGAQILRAREYRPDRPVVPQLFHLASLAQHGDLRVLEDYKKIFESGRRLNFVPMITFEMIQRAIDEAYETIGSSFD